MFENLSEKFQGVPKKLRGHGRITEGNVEGALNEVRLALLEADVNYRVVKEFVAAIREKALGAEARCLLVQIVQTVNQKGHTGKTDIQMSPNIPPRPSV